MLIEQELSFLNQLIIKTITDNNNKLSLDISDYLASKSKRLRPALVFLFSKALGIDIDDQIYHLACCVELIHNSTLVHDDILDNAETRRGKISLNCKIGNSLSVLAGDILLSVALKELAKFGSLEAVNIFSQSLYDMCKGEINQNFSIGKVPSLSEYIQKSEHKTAELYKAVLSSFASVYIKEHQKDIIEFAVNFGIAFQIKDDLINIMKTDHSKPVLSDIYNGIYTAPVIFLCEDTGDINGFSEKEIIDKINSNKKYIDKTVELIKSYSEKAIDSIKFIMDNDYKKEIINLTENLYKAGIYE